MLSLVFIASLLLPPAPQESSVFAPEFRRVDPSVTAFRTIHQSRISNELTLYVVLADPPRNYEVTPESRFWNEDGLLGIFVRDQAGRISLVTTMRNSIGECNVEVDHANANSVVLLRTGTDYGILLSALKLFIDPGARRLLRMVEYWPAALNGIWTQDNTVLVQFVTRDPVSSLAVNALAPNLAFQVAQGEVPAPPERQNLPAGWSFGDSSGSQTEFTGITERVASGPRTYELPKTDLQTLARLRPKAVRDEFGPREVAEIQDHIGPYQLIGTQLWFGKTFYDGEGLTGVGGFGYFDLATRRYVMFAPGSLLDWSASAILAEPDAIWIGLVNRPEGADHPGGLLCYDRNTAQTQVYPLKNVITRIIRHNGVLYLGTDYGLYIMRGSNFTRYVVEPALDGSLAPVEVPWRPAA